MQTLSDFLLQRIAEDEAAAHTESARIDARYASVRGASLAFTDWDLGPGNPARVLAECKAKRQIVEEYAARNDDVDLMMGPDSLRQREWSGLRLAVRTLAAIHADHPEFEEAWRV